MFLLRLGFGDGDTEGEEKGPSFRQLLVPLKRTDSWRATRPEDRRMASGTPDSMLGADKLISLL